MSKKPEDTNKPLAQRMKDARDSIDTSPEAVQAERGAETKDRAADAVQRPREQIAKPDPDMTQDDTRKSAEATHGAVAGQERADRADDKAGRAIPRHAVLPAGPPRPAGEPRNVDHSPAGPGKPLDGSQSVNTYTPEGTQKREFEQGQQDWPRILSANNEVDLDKQLPPLPVDPLPGQTQEEAEAERGTPPLQRAGAIASDKPAPSAKDSKKD